MVRVCSINNREVTIQVCRNHSTYSYHGECFILSQNWQLGYGAKVSTERRKGVLRKVTVNITTEGTAAKLWHPRRLNSINYLTKRKYKKVPIEEDGENKGQKVVYNGKATVVITAASPVSFVYNTIHERCSMSFYVQSYDSSGMAIDATLQGILNS